MRNRNRLSRALVLTWCGLAVGYACNGTETDNPVVDTSSPVDFASPEPGVPGCPYPGMDNLPNVPSGLSRALVVSTSRGDVLALGDDAGGLTLLDVSNPDAPVTLSQGAVRGEIHQLLVSASGELWVAASEPPVLDGSGLPAAAALDPTLHVVRLDVTDPTAPVRVGDVKLEGTFWQMQERGQDLWVLSARLVPQWRGCDAYRVSRESCSGPEFEALTLSGFRPNATQLEPLAHQELPFDWHGGWSGDGVATVLRDGTVHVISWDETGALRQPVSLSPPEAGAVAGPVDIRGSEVSVVSAAANQLTLHVYELAAGGNDPERSFALAGLANGVGVFSLFAEGQLWLQGPEGSQGPAQVWDLTGEAPVRLALPAPFQTVVPLDLPEAAPSDAVLALGWLPLPTGQQSMSLLSVRGQTVSVLEALPDTYLSQSPRNHIDAPASIQGTGSAASSQIVVRGAGLPLGVDPDAPPGYGSASVEALGVVGTAAAGDPLTQAALVARSVPPADLLTGLQPNPTLEVTRAGTTVSFELSPGASSLIPTAHGVVVVDEVQPSQCSQSGRDCTSYVAGVAVFDLSDEPRLAGSLPFPELPLPVPDNPNELSIHWHTYDPLAQLDRVALPLDEQHLAFVAEVELSCDTQAKCDALGIEALPLAEAGVLVGTPARCPPAEIEPDCAATPAPAPPTVYGFGSRLYFYALELDAPGAPAWQAWGVSTLESISGLQDRSSRFAGPLASNGTLASTRLERRASSGDLLPPGEARFMLDRFEAPVSGAPVASAPVNVPGYPAAFLGGDATAERWVSVEAAPGLTGRAHVHRLLIDDAGAHIEQSLELSDGSFKGLWPFQVGDAWLGLTLVTPSDACGTTRVTALRLGTSAGAADEPLEVASTLELPSDRWSLVATDANRALFQRDLMYVLVELASDGTLSAVSARDTDVYLNGMQLLGKSAWGAAGRFGSKRLDF